jgi:hypothetical protein
MRGGTMKLDRTRALLALIAVTASIAAPAATAVPSQQSEEHPDQVLDWNQIFVDTLIATNTPNSSSQRLGAIVHAAIFDAYNGIERRYAPIFVDDQAPAGASRRAAVIAAAYRTLVALFPARETQLSASYGASLAALSDDGETAADRASAASPGESRSRRPCSVGVRTTASAAAIPRSSVGPRSGSGGRHRLCSGR